jgi:hypothetical protein
MLADCNEDRASWWIGLDDESVKGGLRAIVSYVADVFYPRYGTVPYVFNEDSELSRYRARFFDIEGRDFVALVSIRETRKFSVFQNPKAQAILVMSLKESRRPRAGGA